MVHFNDETYFDNPDGKDFLTSPPEADGAGRTEPSGGTAMRDAVQLAIGWLKKAHKEKKVLVVVTDGEDNASSDVNGLENVVRSARQNEVLIYSVGLLSEDHKAAGSARHQLNELSEATGGRAFTPRKWPKWMPSLIRWRAICATSTPSNTHFQQSGDGRIIPQDSGGGEGPRRPIGAHPYGILRYPGTGCRRRPCLRVQITTIIEATMLWKPLRL